MKFKHDFCNAVKFCITLTAIFTLILSGCSGEDATSTTVKITPYKGKFSSGAVTLTDAKGVAIVLLNGSGSINANGTAQVTFNANAAYPIFVNVTGTYQDEVSGGTATITSTTPLRGIIPDAQATTAGVPVTAITEIAVTKLQSEFPALTGITTSSAKLRITESAAGVLGQTYAQAMTPPVFDSQGKTTDSNTLQLAALAVVANTQGTGADLITKVKSVATQLASGSLISTVIPPATYNNAVVAVNGGPNSVLPEGTTSPPNVAPFTPIGNIFSAPLSTVATTRDAKGVWFITGSEKERLYDVFEAVGYAVATDRLWQAETFRRSARGRLAEIFGATQLAQDKLVRTTGYSDQELQEGFASIDAESQGVINGYVAGFNKRIAEIRATPSLLPYEFAAVGITSVTLEDWTYKDVLSWASLMLRNFDPEAQTTGQIDNAALYQGLVAAYGATQGPRMFGDLRWVNDTDALTYIPKPTKVSKVLRLQASTGEIPSSLVENTPSFPNISEVASSMAEQRSQIDENLKKINAYVKMGSYAWAVKGSKTASGNAIIYSGPQMGFTVPSIIGEGSIRAGGLNISGMHIAGLPSIVIGRTPHHAWSMQVGHAHTVDYYMESAAAMTLNRTETVKVKGAADVVLPIYRTTHGPVVNATPPISWKYSQWGHEFKVVRAYIDLARATSMDQFGAAIDLVPVSQHFTYADRDGNIAYWMSGRDPVRPAGEWRLPQGAAGTALEWDSANLIPRSTDRNTSKGFYSGWNNKANSSYTNSWNNPSYAFGAFHRAHVIDDYLSTTNNLTFTQVRDLALNIATTDSFGSGGNPWKFVSDSFTAAVNTAPDAPNAGRSAALALLASWDGHFVDGGSGSWAAGTNRADAWMLMDAWIKEVLKLTFEELDPATLSTAKNSLVLFNVLIHSLTPGSVTNYYDWFKNADLTAPQTASAIIVKALDNTLTTLGAKPWGTNKRSVITYNHALMGKVWEMPFSSRSTYAHTVEYSSAGPVKIQSMFPLGESGNISGTPPAAPAASDFNAHFFSMTSVYDGFVYRDFPLFTP
jgi:penicillin amidase